MKAVTRKRYSAEFKAQAVALVGLGKPVPEVAAELEIGTSILYGWIRKGSQPGHLGSGGLQAVGEPPAADVLPWLRRENARLKLENDILKKAAVILGTRPLPEAVR
jgi:transposase